VSAPNSGVRSTDMAHVAGRGSRVAISSRPAERIRRGAASTIFWLATVSYIVTFVAISLQEYHAYIPNALDLGNMAQAFWNTVHGHPFRFQNMRDTVSIEAYGTSTRLSFHVEPILPFLAVVYFFYQHVETLLVMQTVAVASGAIPVRLLARNHLANPVAEVAFPIAYLLYPALEAANLFEFHPVTVAVPFILWAFWFADARRYSWFAVAAVCVMGSKEELGVLVALMGLWIAVRNGERRFGAVVAVLGLLWSFLALKVIVPHFNNAHSPYLDRFLPPAYGTSSVIGFWFHHFDLVWSNLTSQAKASYLHRILVPAGYLSLLSPLTVLVAVPSLAIVMLSYDPYMVGGLAHYSAEIVPVMIVAAIMGAEWFAKHVAPRLHMRFELAVTVCSIYVLFASLANQRVNGFTPLAANFWYPTITAHDRIVDRALALIPSNASVSAQNNLNAHLSDRGQIYLYSDLNYGQVQYIALDVTQPAGTLLRPCDLVVQVTGNVNACDPLAGEAPAQAAQTNQNALLQNGKWTIIFAQDGVLILKRHQQGEPLVTTLPPQFYTFMNPPASDLPPGKPIARFGNYLELEGLQISRAEVASLRNPDVVVTSWWRVLQPLPSQARLLHCVTNTAGALFVVAHDQAATDWSLLSQWQPGKLYKVVSPNLPISTGLSGNVGVYLGLADSIGSYGNTANDEPVTMLNPRPGVRTVGHGVAARFLRVATIRVTM